MPPSGPASPLGGTVFSMSGKVALVTGAFGGLGRHFARTLAEAGARVALTGRRIAEGEHSCAELQSLGHDARAFPMDVTSSTSVNETVNSIVEHFGSIDVLVNNAGITVVKPLLDYTEEDWNSVVDVNLSGAWRVAKAVASRMTSNDSGGSIINIASILGVRVSQQLTAYAASKAGLIQLTKAMALELARYRIRVNAIAPGYFETDMNRDFFATEEGKALIRRIPQRQLGKASDLDGPLLLLASNASDFMTGSVLVADGGHSINSL